MLKERKSDIAAAATAVGETSGLAGGRRVTAHGGRSSEKMKRMCVCKQMVVNKVMISN